jgi:DNA-binding winged helix-turn-helix (wHTH) protein
LQKDGFIEHLQPQVRNVLLVLVEHAGEVVSKDTLLEQAWHGRAASDECLTRCISILRRQLCDQTDRHLIETIPRVGYRLHLDVPAPSNDPFHTHWAAREQSGLAPDQLVRISITAASMLAVTGILLLLTI